MMTYVDGGDRNQVRLITYDILANRPAAGIAGRLYWTTDEHILYRDTGAAWEKVAVADYADLDGIPASFPPSAHVLATTGPHTNELPLTDLAAGVQGQVIHRGAVDWEVLAVGVAAEVLTSGGPGADVSWVAPGAPGAHEATHVAGGVDDIDAPLDARALAFANQGEIVFRAAAANTLAALGVGVAGQALLTGGPAANPAWGAPAPAAHEATHVLGGADDIDSGLDARALNLTNQGEIVFRAAAANTLGVLATGVAGQALLTGGAGADPSWGAPAPAAHAPSHKDGGADELDVAELAGAIGSAGEIPETDGAAVSWVDPDGRYDPKAHASTHESAGSDEIRNIELNPGLADETGSGFLALVTVGEAVVTGDTLFLENDGKYWKSDADAAASMPAKVIVIDATIAQDATGKVMHEGYYRNDDRYNWTPGSGAANLLFAHTTAGELVQLANQPAGAGDQVQVCGWIVNANVIYWRPSLELVEIA